MGKADDLRKRLERRDRSKSSREERRRAAQPELRLKPDVSLDVTPETPIHNILGHVAAEGVRSVELKGHSLAVDAVVVPVDHYIELVAKGLRGSGDLRIRTDGHLEPRELAASEVEQADPTASWDKVFRPDRFAP